MPDNKLGQQLFNASDGTKLAYHHTAPQDKASPTVVFIGGFMSDMTGGKATHLEGHCQKQGYGYLRFDYQGHGGSSGEFSDGTISIWANNAFDIIAGLTSGPLILIGSSMGGWISMLVIPRLGRRVMAFMGIAAAPDFTHKMMLPNFTIRQLVELRDKGKTYIPNDYDEPYTITRALMDDGGANQIMDGPIDIDIPVRLLQGTEDSSVPADWPEKIKARLTSENVEITIVDGGDHSLSTDENLALLTAMLDDLIK
jgi:pimeloyl-ACP methyl ester carboxylesterase